jgi:hypothetical protein
LMPHFVGWHYLAHQRNNIPACSFYFAHLIMEKKERDE